MRAGGQRLGLWLIGAGGNVATTVAVGLAALRRNLAGPTGLVTELPALSELELAHPQAIALGGHEIAGVSPGVRAREMAGEERLFPEALAEAVQDDLEAFGEEIRPGVAALSRGEGDGADRVRALQEDWRRFIERQDLDRLVVVNVASTEPPMPSPLPADPAELSRRIERGGETPASVLYAYAALDASHAYVNFTPSTGSVIPALEALAEKRRTVHAGRDGKTGETLLKSALAPMFAARHLRVLSWFGQNVLGNPDGATLTDPRMQASKTRSKSTIVPAILGYEPSAHVGIDYLEPLGDWKIAWDHVLFEGFLGTRMSLSLTWEGADSVLAAPLVLDLARLVDLALRRGEVGVLRHLAVFFKDPHGSGEHALDRQMALLLEHLRS